jgi:ATP-dependent Clp protease ATP-binding subunit ClpA
LARVIQEYIKKPLAEEILFGALKDGGTVRVLVEEKDGEKALGFDYIKPDAPIKPRDPDGGAKKPRAKRAKKPRGGARSGSSSVPKVPLGES